MCEVSHLHRKFHYIVHSNLSNITFVATKVHVIVKRYVSVNIVTWLIEILV